jgi:acyl carrier protein
MTMDELKNELFTYVKENTFKETDSLQSDTMLFVEGLLDSMGFALLLDFLETKFQIAAEDSDLVEENFESIDAIADFITRKNPALVKAA